MKKMFLTCTAGLVLFLSQAIAEPQTPVTPSTDTATELAPATAPVKPEATWRDTLAKVKGLAATTGIKGFMTSEAPEYLTKGYLTPEGALIPGHEIKVIGNLPYESWSYSASD